jgi:hypothetical protein
MKHLISSCSTRHFSVHVHYKMNQQANSLKQRDYPRESKENDWTNVTDRLQRRRMQNRNSQRDYRMFSLVKLQLLYVLTVI